MDETLLRSWGLLAMRGGLAIAFGTAAILLPAITLSTLAALFAAFALLAGAVWLFSAVRNRTHDDRWWMHLLVGAFSVGAGLIAALYPGVTIVALVLLVGANALVTGVLDLVVAIRVRRHIKGEWLLVLNGIASTAFGILVLLFPLGAGALALAWLIGLYSIVTGVVLLALALKVRAWTRITAPRSSPAAGPARKPDDSVKHG